jgi:hypothetical protein
MELRVIRIEPNIQKISVKMTTLSLSTCAILQRKENQPLPSHTLHLAKGWFHLETNTAHELHPLRVIPDTPSYMECLVL